jgi:hypothetical protein
MAHLVSRRRFCGTLALTIAPAVVRAARREPSNQAPRNALDPATRTYHVFPGTSIQETLERAARDPVNKRVLVHAGTYRPRERGQALIWFNARHDGITLEADGDVTLSGANPDLADPKAPSFPAAVTRVVYFGDGVSRATVLRGFRISGANNLTLGTGQRSPIESDDIRKTPYFFADGGGIKVYARSYPTIEHVEVFDNYTSPCGAGVSVEHLGRPQDAAVFRHCIFRDNRTQITGAAVDLLHGSAAVLENCLFARNVSNMGVDYVGMLTGGEYLAEHGSGALTVFAGSRATVSRCTFTDNWNGVDDHGSGSTYVDSIFWRNVRPGGISPGDRYELDITEGAGVRGSFIHGAINDLRQTVDAARNTFNPPDPRFDADFVPSHPAYAAVGYRPVARPRA